MNLTGSGMLDDCAQSSDITDNNGDGYDDVSYDAGFSDGAGADYADGYDDGYVDGAESGDLNLDGGNDVLDVVMLIDIIINP